MDEATTSAPEAYKMMTDAVNDGTLSPSGFVSSLIKQFETKGRLSPKQVSWAVKLTLAATKPMIVKETIGDYNTLATSFKAIDSPKLIFSLRGETSVRLTASPKHGKNPDHIYVKLNGEYAGKITPTGDFQNVRTLNFQGLKSLVDMFTMIESFGLSEYITHYGKDSGICCCCGRELTDPQSISAGIGPVCAVRWNIARPAIKIA